MCLFNISHFSSTECSEVMSKRTRKDSGEERVTAKSKPMMNLVSRCSERTPVVLPSTASESPGHFVQTESRVSCPREFKKVLRKRWSAVAKPRPMNLASKNFLSATKDPPQYLRDLNCPENQELDKSCVSSRGRKLTRNINPNPTMYSQGGQHDDTQSSSTRKLGRGEDNHIGRSKLHFHNMQIFDYRYFEKVFKNLLKI